MGAVHVHVRAAIQFFALMMVGVGMRRVHDVCSIATTPASGTAFASQ